MKNQIIDIEVTFGEAFFWFWKTTIAGLLVTIILGAVLALVVWLPMKIIEENSEQPSAEQQLLDSQEDARLRLLRALESL